MKTLTRPTGRTTTRTKKASPRIVSRDADRHLYWIKRNTIWQSYYNYVDDDGVPCISVSTPFTTEAAVGMIVGTRQPLSVTEDDIEYDKDAACAELAELMETATFENYEVHHCGTWTRITFRNVRFYWDK